MKSQEKRMREVMRLFEISSGIRRTMWVILVACVGFVSPVFFSSSAAAEICDQLAKGIDPSRRPTPAEAQLINVSEIELLEWTDYVTGVVIVDVDNDGIDDVLAWRIAGSGRFGMGEAYGFSEDQSKLNRKFSIDLGVLQDPRIVRLDGINYLLVTDSGDEDGMRVLRVSQSTAGKYQRQTVCRMQTEVKAETKCHHPACRHLQWLIDKGDAAADFVNVVWPHKYFAPAGLEVYFPEEGSEGDFDNSGRPTTVWRIGIKGYAFEYIYWGLLGQGDEYPMVDPVQRRQDEGAFRRRVMEGDQHARLQRVLREQGNVLSRQLGRKISLPAEGEFFLFNATNRTYWAWDLGRPPYGEQVHVLYTNASKTDYIGAINVKRSTALKQCSKDCEVMLAP